LVTLAENAEWRRFAAADAVDAMTFREGVLATLDEPQVAELTALLASARDAEKFSAIALLMPLRQFGDPRLPAAIALQLDRQIEDIVRLEYPRTRASIAAFSSWRQISQPDSLAFLLAMDLAQVGSGHLIQVVRDLAIFVGDARALARFEELPLPSGEAKEWRDARLKRIRPLPEEELKKLAARWRKSRSPRVLGQIYDLYICRIRPGTVRMEELLRLLGTPDVGDEQDCHYHPNEGTALYLQGDADGHLHAYSFT
jgi:hypothetical protein